MPLWVDTDACPRVIKDVLLRGAQRAEIMLYLVANQQALFVPPALYIKSTRVSGGCLRGQCEQ